MTRDEIATLFTRWRSALTRRDAAALAAFYSDTCSVESPMAGHVTGRAGVEQVYRAWFTAFPDGAFEIEEVVIEGERVVQVGTAAGTDTGGFMGLPPTGKAYRFSVVFLSSVEAGQIVRERRVYDFTGVLVQIGMLKAKPA